MPRFCADTLLYLGGIVDALCLTVLQYYFLPVMATGSSWVGTDKEDSDLAIEVDEQTPWNAREACVMLDSSGVFESDTTYIPDVLGLSSRYPDASPVGPKYSGFNSGRKIIRLWVPPCYTSGHGRCGGACCACGGPVPLETSMAYCGAFQYVSKTVGI